jgi:hypothetical protein
MAFILYVALTLFMPVFLDFVFVCVSVAFLLLRLFFHFLLLLLHRFVIRAIVVLGAVVDDGWLACDHMRHGLQRAGYTAEQLRLQHTVTGMMRDGASTFHCRIPQCIMLGLEHLIVQQRCEHFERSLTVSFGHIGLGTGILRDAQYAAAQRGRGRQQPEQDASGVEIGAPGFSARRRATCVVVSIVVRGVAGGGRSRWLPLTPLWSDRCRAAQVAQQNRQQAKVEQLFILRVRTDNNHV